MARNNETPVSEYKCMLVRPSEANNAAAKLRIAGWRVTMQLSTRGNVLLRATRYEGSNKESHESVARA